MFGRRGVGVAERCYVCYNFESLLCATCSTVALSVTRHSTCFRLGGTRGWTQDIPPYDRKPKGSASLRCDTTFLKACCVRCPTAALSDTRQMVCTSKYIYTQVYIYFELFMYSIGGKPGDGPRISPYDHRPTGSARLRLDISMLKACCLRCPAAALSNTRHRIHIVFYEVYISTWKTRGWI